MVALSCPDDFETTHQSPLLDILQLVLLSIVMSKLPASLETFLLFGVADRVFGSSFLQLADNKMTTAMPAIPISWVTFFITFGFCLNLYFKHINIILSITWRQAGLQVFC